MAKHHIVCIHGIGKHSQEWATKDPDDGGTFAATVKAVWKKYPSLAKKDIDSVLDLQSICYDDEITDLLKNWEGQAEAIRKALDGSPLLSAESEWVTKALESASGEAGTDPSADEDWRRTHLVDLLLIAGSPTIQDDLVVHVGDQILELIRKWADEENQMPQVSIIGHSAGCAMAHKALQAISNEKVKGNSLRPHYQFWMVCMIANTSYALSRVRDDHYTGWVRPSLTVGEGCCRRWINVNHELDPIGRFMRFDYKKEPQWLDPAIDMRHWHRDIQLHHLTSRDIHSINHYFRDPAFHVPFFEFTAGAAFGEKELTKGLEDFKATTLDDKLKSLQAYLKKLDPAGATSFKDWFAALRGLLNV